MGSPTGPGLAVEDRMGLCCHLEGYGSTAAMTRKSLGMRAFLSA